MKKNWLTISIIILLVICAIMVIIYFSYVSNHFSTNSADWGNFGCYLGSITGLLAFAGVLYSIQQSNKTHTEDSERDTFFRLLDLHTNKMNSVEFSGIKNSTTLSGIKGAEAFKKYVDVANHLLAVTIIQNRIKQEYKDIDISKYGVFDEIEYPSEEVYNMLKYLFSIFNNYSCGKDYKISRDDFELILSINNYDKIYSRYESCTLQLEVDKFLPNEIDITALYDAIRNIGDFVYSKYGYILGHYFRNMYYVMDSINVFSDKKNYKELFRAQLSRYELALGLFNAVSSNSSCKMICLLKEFKIFKDTYPNDITVLKVLMDKGVSNDDTNQDKMLTITNEVLNEWKP